MKDTTTPAEGATSPPADGRQAYEKPAISWEETWEAHANLMAGCGQKDAMQPTCEFDLLS